MKKISSEKLDQLVNQFMSENSADMATDEGWDKFEKWLKKDYTIKNKTCSDCKVNKATKEQAGNYYCKDCYHNRYYNIN